MFSILRVLLLISTHTLLFCRHISDQSMKGVLQPGFFFCLFFFSFPPALTNLKPKFFIKEPEVSILVWFRLRNWTNKCENSLTVIVQCFSFHVVHSLSEQVNPTQRLRTDGFRMKRLGDYWMDSQQTQHWLCMEILFSQLRALNTRHFFPIIHVPTFLENPDQRYWSPVNFDQCCSWQIVVPGWRSWRDSHQAHSYFCMYRIWLAFIANYNSDWM